MKQSRKPASRKPLPGSAEDGVLFTEEEAAKRLRQPERTLQYWRWQGMGPRYVKQGRRVTYRREALDDWISKQERGTTSEKSSKTRRPIIPTPDGGPSV